LFAAALNKPSVKLNSFYLGKLQLCKVSLLQKTPIIIYQEKRMDDAMEQPCCQQFLTRHEPATGGTQMRMRRAIIGS